MTAWQDSGWTEQKLGICFNIFQEFQNSLLMYLNLIGFNNLYKSLINYC